MKTGEHHRNAKRRRLPLVFAAAVVLWTSGWYCWNASMGLFYVALACSIVALLMPRSLPSTARSAIWSAVLFVILVLAANISRIMPPEDTADLARSYIYDRVGTIVFAFSLTALFFRPSTAALTVVFSSCLPMLMIVLVRDHTRFGGDRDPLIIWGALMLMMLAGQVQRMGVTRRWGSPPMSGAEVRRRLIACVLVIGCAWLLTFPLTSGAHLARSWVFDRFRYHSRKSSDSSRDDMLSLQSPTTSFANKTRVLMEIDAPDAPGYLREAVYVHFAGEKWLRDTKAADQRALKTMPTHGMDGRSAYAIIDTVEENWNDDALTMNFDVLSPSQLSSFCLPGHAEILLIHDDETPLLGADGIVSPELLLPKRFYVQFPQRHLDRAYPLPQVENTSSDYQSIPGVIEPAVMDWIARCSDLTNATTTTEKILRLKHWFSKNFDYSLRPLPTAGSPLAAFMKVKKGHCTLFASSTALMLRGVGVPSRVVGGYLCNERHPLTGRWTVRERDGHAWCEAWDSSRSRWVLVETTPPSGLPGGYQQPAYHKLAFEWLRSLWKRFVYYLQNQNPLVLLATAGVWIYFRISNFIMMPIGRLLVGGVVLLIIARIWRKRRRVSVIDPDAKLRSRLIRKMQAHERRYATDARLRRKPEEPWEHWLRRISAELPVSQSKPLNDLLAEYQQLRYAPEMDRERVTRWLHD